MGTHIGVALTQIKIKHMINSSSALNKPSSFGEQNYQQKLLLNSLPMWVELDETLFSTFFFFLRIIY